MPGKSSSWPVLALLVLAAGCGESKAPDKEVIDSPTGLWISSADSGTTIDIQNGGIISVTQGGKESHGTWKETKKGTIEATTDGTTYQLPYTRRDLKLHITLPGQNQPTDMTQM